MKNRIESSGHRSVRKFLRLAGPLVALTGLGFMAVGVIDFFSAFGSFGREPKLFWCLFVGMPLLFVGIVMCKLGYFGAVFRYLAAETAPVARDTVNYMAEGTQDAVKTVARAATEGVRQGLGDEPDNREAGKI